MNKIKLLAKKVELISSSSVALISVVMFYIFATFYASFVYIQFSITTIVLVSAAFLSILFTLVFLFTPIIFKEKPKLGLGTILWAFITSGFLVAVLNSPNTEDYIYFPTYPLLDSELGIGWHPDSVFHAAIIQSLKNFYFPSTGQHGTPILNYHVFSHYIDSLIIRITGVDVWDSYGMFFYFKGVTLLSAILLFVASVTFHLNFYAFIISVVFLSPIVIGRWHAISSHGLWFTSLLIILSAPLVYKLLSQNASLRTSKYLYLFALLLAISLGKISSGFMYSALVGFCLLQSHFRDVRLYVFGTALLFFYWIYNSLMSGSYGMTVMPDLGDIFTFVSLRTDIFWFQLHQIYIMILLLGITALLFMSNFSLRLFIASCLSVLVLATIVSMQPNFSKSDIWYFCYGLSSVLILMIYQTLIQNFYSYNLKQANMKMRLFNFMRIGFVIILLGSTKTLDLGEFNVFNLRAETFQNALSNADVHPFSGLNDYDKELRAEFIEQLRDRKYINLNKYSRPLSDFKDELFVFMRSNKLSPTNTLLYVPKEIFEGDFGQFKGESWARGLLLYAVTGVPLVHGVQSLRGDYGYADYDSRALWVPRDSFDENITCQLGKDVIIVESFKRNYFRLVRCDPSPMNSSYTIGHDD